MKAKITFTFISVFFIAAFSNAQEKSSSLFRKGDSWVELRQGINFDAKRMDYFNYQWAGITVPLEREVSNNYFIGLSYSEFLTNSFMLGIELNYAYQDAPRQPRGLNSVSQMGVGVNARQYFLPIQDQFSFFSNFNAGIYFFQLDDWIDTAESYFRMSLDLGVSYLPNERLQVSLFMPDIVTFLDKRRNFDAAASGFNFMHNQVFKYPMIGISYRLENIKHVILQKEED